VPIAEGGVLKDDEHMGVSFIIGQVLSVNKQFFVAMQKKYAQWYVWPFTLDSPVCSLSPTRLVCLTTQAY
jgi:hypothetical protein